MSVQLKLPDPRDYLLEIIAIGLVVGAIALLAWNLWQGGRRAVNFANVTAKLESTEESAALSKEADDRAGQIIGDMNHEAIEDRRAVAAARAPGATAADRERVRQRAREAFAEGQGAACGLQRADCGPAASGPSRE